MYVPLPLSTLVVLQLKVKRCFVYSAILCIWILIPAFQTTAASVSTDIVNGICIPWGAYSSYALEKTMVFFVFVVGYVLPLVLMIFFYSKCVSALRSKVTSPSESFIAPLRESSPKKRSGMDCNGVT